MEWCAKDDNVCPAPYTNWERFYLTGSVGLVPANDKGMDQLNLSDSNHSWYCKRILVVTKMTRISSVRKQYLQGPRYHQVHKLGVSSIGPYFCLHVAIRLLCLFIHTLHVLDSSDYSCKCFQQGSAAWENAVPEFPLFRHDTIKDPQRAPWPWFPRY